MESLRNLACVLLSWFASLAGWVSPEIQGLSKELVNAVAVWLLLMALSYVKNRIAELLKKKK